MARVNEAILKSVGFLYQNEAEARAGTAKGGTAFLVSVPAPEAVAEGIQDQLPHGFCHVYVVSASHVVRDGYTTLRLNRVYGAPEILALPKAVQPCSDTDSWIVHEEGNDIAIYPLAEFPNRKYAAIPIDTFATTAGRLDEEPFEEIVKERFKVAVGDEVFMPGRLLDLKNPNPPVVVRFGRLATLPTVEIGNKSVWGNQESYLAELRSDSGYSGAPVLVNEAPELSATESDTVTIKERTWLLGVNWGHLQHDDPVMVGDEKCGPLTAKSNSGISTIVPVWRLSQLLNDPGLVERRKALWGAVKASLRSGTHGVLDLGDRTPTV